MPDSRSTVTRKIVQRGSNRSMASPRPIWNRALRELRVGDVLVKHFRTPAPNQELVLSAFEEQDWPAQIDDPLPPARGGNAKLRLRDVISKLNRHQRAMLIRFRGDGRGQAVRWEFVEASK